MRQIVLYPDPQDGGFCAEVPSLPGCYSQGDDREDALRNIRDAIAVWLDGAEAEGLHVPKETFGTEVIVLPDVDEDRAVGVAPTAAHA